MTSSFRSPSQINTRIKYFLTFGATNTFTWETETDPEAVTYTVPSGQNDALSSGTLLRDMGKFVTLVAADGQHIAVYRLVQVVNGADSEGVPTDSNTFYVCTWAADPTDINTVTVVRTG